jgi:hypothetical protein
MTRGPAVVRKSGKLREQVQAGQFIGANFVAQARRFPREVRATARV